MVKKVYWAFIGFVVSIIVIACSNEPQIADKTLYQTQQEQRDKYMPYMYGTWSGFRVFDDNLRAASIKLELDIDGTFKMEDVMFERNTPQSPWQEKGDDFNDMRNGIWKLVCKRNDKDSNMIETYLVLDERQQNGHVIEYVLFHDVDASKLHIELLYLTELTKVTPP